MKIPNYDTKSPTQGRSLCKFLDEDFRLLISGQRWLRKNKHGYAHFAKTSCLL